YVLPRFLPQTVSGDPAAIGADLASQTEKITALQAELESLKGAVAAPATAAIPDEVTAGIAQLGDRLQALEQATAGNGDRIGQLEARLDAAESRPVTGDAASAGALDAIRREMEGYRAEIGAQLKAVEAAKGDIGAAAEAAAAKVASVEAEAERLRNEATAAAEEAARTGSLSLILSALESGAAIDAPLADLTAAGVEVPAALAEQAQGVPTLASLRESFPEAARAALAVTVRDASGTDAWGRITAFFRSQSGARSLAPRAGDDPDAILSRAEANLRAGDLAQTLTELASLPENGRAVMAEWIARAARRQEAVTAAETLQQQVK
ncbi:MAG: COG4223 family protein, partial [Albidovulum sp.]